MIARTVYCGTELLDGPCSVYAHTKLVSATYIEL